MRRQRKGGRKTEYFATYGDILRKSPLFDGVGALEHTLRCLSPEFREFKKETTVLNHDYAPYEFGVVLKGSVYAERVDFSGDRTVSGSVGAGGVFGEILASGLGRPSPVVVRAAENCAVLLFDYNRVSATCDHNCIDHRAIIKNLFRVIGRQFFDMADRLYCMGKRSLRGKITAYLSLCAANARNKTFKTGLTRDALADYLGADRSALSRELSRMKREGLIDYWRDSFKILTRDNFDT